MVPRSGAGFQRANQRINLRSKGFLHDLDQIKLRKKNVQRVTIPKISKHDTMTQQYLP